MWISCRFPSGDSFKYLVRRYGDVITFSFEDNHMASSVQQKIVKAWLDANHTSSYGDLFNKLKQLCHTCKSGKELITKMNNRHV